jgi:hypothetical protein
MSEADLFAQVKASSSCIRSADLLARIGRSPRLNQNPKPEEGDIVLTRVLSDSGAWDFIETTAGLETRLYSGDYILSILGTRRSGTNPSGTLPAGALERGDILSLVSASGLVAVADSTPRFYREPRTVQVEAFFGTPEHLLNLRDSSPVVSDTSKAAFGIVLVVGTSAEAGKTTAVTRLIRAFRQTVPELRMGAIKACGTGRLKDSMAFRDAGANSVVDFVDFGWPSTYNITSSAYRSVLQKMLATMDGLEIVFVEIGGDLLEGRAPEALEELSALRAMPLLCANDAMGAITGLGILAKYGWDDVAVASHRQNLKCLQARLAGRPTLDTADGPALANLASSLLRRLR